MNLNTKFFNPIGFLTGIVTGMVISLATGNFWIGLAVGIIMGVFISPLYTDKKRLDRIKIVSAFWTTLAVLVILVVALAILLSSI